METKQSTQKQQELTHLVGNRSQEAPKALSPGLEWKRRRRKETKKKKRKEKKKKRRKKKGKKKDPPPPPSHHTGQTDSSFHRISGPVC